MDLHVLGGRIGMGNTFVFNWSISFFFPFVHWETHLYFIFLGLSDSVHVCVRVCVPFCYYFSDFVFTICL